MKTNFWYYLLLFITFVFSVAVLYKISKRKRQRQEGFSQDKPYILKREDNIYDDFYAQIYDTIYNSPEYIKTIITEIENTTQASPTSSVFLDVGSKTGKIVSELYQRGYEVYGVEPQTAMIEYTREYQPIIAEACTKGNVDNSILYDHNSFSHILCLHGMIYQIENKGIFFRNCYLWLKPGGVLLLQIYHSTTNSNKTTTLFQNDFGSFEFHSYFDKTGKYMEKFTDKSSMNVRENEIQVYDMDTSSILQEAGFGRLDLIGKIILPKPNDDIENILYILVRPS
jgi:SAM-dependent methyltransferase